MTGREPEFLRDGSAVYLNGCYTFEELVEIALNSRLNAEAKPADWGLATSAVNSAAQAAGFEG
jgi:hypothetical protein